MAATTVKAGKPILLEIECVFDPRLVPSRQGIPLTVDMEVAGTDSHEDAVKGLLVVKVSVADDEGLIRAKCTIGMHITAVGGTLPELDLDHRHDLVCRLYDKARVLLAAVTDHGGWPPLLLPQFDGTPSGQDVGKPVAGPGLPKDASSNARHRGPGKTKPNPTA